MAEHESTDLVVVSGKKLAEQKSTSLAELYDRYTKLIFLLDVSVSMSGAMDDDSSKLHVLQDAARTYINRRYDKYPDAVVLVYAFDTTVRRLSGAVGLAGRDAALAAVDGLSLGGGTDITLAVAAAVSECQRRPSKTGAHHVILVSDGLDGSAESVAGLLPAIKSTSVVFDLILIRRADSLAHPIQAAPILQQVCAETGGEYVEVSSVAEFRTKFAQLADRRCLPPSGV